MEYKHLTAEERYQIDDMRREGFNQRKIALALSVRPLPSVENCIAMKVLCWKLRQAQLKAMERLGVRGSGNVKLASTSAWDYVKKHLQQDQWSPEQITGRLALEGLDAISHETIYQ